MEKTTQARGPGWTPLCPRHCQSATLGSCSRPTIGIPNSGHSSQHMTGATCDAASKISDPERSKPVKFLQWETVFSPHPFMESAIFRDWICIIQLLESKNLGHTLAMKLYQKIIYLHLIWWKRINTASAAKIFNFSFHLVFWGYTRGNHVSDCLLLLSEGWSKPHIF